MLSPRTKIPHHIGPPKHNQLDQQFPHLQLDRSHLPPQPSHRTQHIQHELASAILPQLGNLSALVSLDMGDNFFNGSIPPSLFNIPTLEVLILRNNSLSGSLPVDICRNGASRLRNLWLMTNGLFREIPASIWMCLQLEYVRLRVGNFILSSAQKRRSFVNSGDFGRLWDVIGTFN
ncbi:hypothetical protein ACS0TY_033422 [Phlomoides rotata]